MSHGGAFCSRCTIADALVYGTAKKSSRFGYLCAHRIFSAVLCHSRSDKNGVQDEVFEQEARAQRYSDMSVIAQQKLTECPEYALLGCCLKTA